MFGKIHNFINQLVYHAPPFMSVNRCVSGFTAVIFTVILLEMRVIIYGNSIYYSLPLSEHSMPIIHDTRCCPLECSLPLSEHSMPKYIY